MILVGEEILYHKRGRTRRNEHLAVKVVADPLRSILYVILVNDIRGLLLLGADNLAHDFVVVAVKSLAEDFATDRVELGDEVRCEEAQIVFL